MTGSETNQLLLASAVAGDKKTKEETLLLPADVKLSLPLHILSPITEAEAIARLFSSLAISHYTHTHKHLHHPTHRLFFGASVPTQGCVLEVVLPDFACTQIYHYMTLISFIHSYIYSVNVC